MTFHSEYEAEKHRHLLRLYTQKVPFLSRGMFKVYLCFAATVIWIAVWIEAAVRYFSLAYVDFSIKNPRIYILPIVLFFAAWKLFKPYKLFTEKTYFGGITDIKYKKKQVRSHFAGRRIYYTAALEGTLFITDEKGKVHKKKLFLSQALHKLYQKGLTVTVIKGEKYPLCHDKTKYEGKLPCIHCGNLEDASYNRCFNCRKLLWTKES